MKISDRVLKEKVYFIEAVDNGCETSVAAKEKVDKIIEEFKKLGIFDEEGCYKVNSEIADRAIKFAG